MKYLSKQPFSVPMPGNDAKQWPACDEPINSPILPFPHRCQLEFGHPDDHRSGIVTWPRERWVWRNGKREAA